MVLHLNKLESQGCFVPSLVEISSVVLENSSVNVKPTTGIEPVPQSFRNELACTSTPCWHSSELILHKIYIRI